jgi:xylulokinase
MFVPHLRVAGPPRQDDRARGAFVGLTDATSRADLARAVAEGLAYEFLFSLDGLRQALGIELERMLVIGGGARNDLGVAIKQSLLDLPVERSAVVEATALGAAMLAAAGAGVHADVPTAARAMASPATPPAVPPEDGAWHRAAYARYNAIYPALREVHHTISDAHAG